jgi:hypothetical protein
MCTWRSGGGALGALGAGRGGIRQLHEQENAAAVEEDEEMKREDGATKGGQSREAPIPKSDRCTMYRSECE